MDEGRPTAAPSDDEAADPRPAADWLLQRYVDSGDEAAFRELVVQHSDLVWGVCRRILRHQHDAEEAFQATLMVLAAKAGDVRRGRLGPWLYGVAYRVAVRAHQRRARRQMDALPQDVAAAANDSLHGVWEAHWRRALDDELNELPEKYREPLVLHYLQGMTNAQTAAAL
ncbi:MAG TPA: sigma-70 family RNA polymerase sigma factor, partial [Lacipirellulaceae bacterium]|nr:sigma-70 family RNA polymerase sigma factor [Lacipirellulaceae bacterium]